MMFLWTALPRLLECAVFVVGLVLIGSRVQGRPRALGLAGCGVLLAMSIIGVGYAVAVTPMYDRFGASAFTLLGVFAFLRTLGSVVGLGLLIAAVVAPRPTPGVNNPPGVFDGHGYGRPTR